MTHIIQLILIYVTITYKYTIHMYNMVYNEWTDDVYYGL